MIPFPKSKDWHLFLLSYKEARRLLKVAHQCTSWRHQANNNWNHQRKGLREGCSERPRLAMCARQRRDCPPGNWRISSHQGCPMCWCSESRLCLGSAHSANSACIEDADCASRRSGCKSTSRSTTARYSRSWWGWTRCWRTWHHRAPWSPTTRWRLKCRWLNKQFRLIQEGKLRLRVAVWSSTCCCGCRRATRASLQKALYSFLFIIK